MPFGPNGRAACWAGENMEADSVNTVGHDIAFKVGENRLIRHGTRHDRKCGQTANTTANKNAANLILEIPICRSDYLSRVSLRTCIRESCASRAKYSPLGKRRAVIRLAVPCELILTGNQVRQIKRTHLLTKQVVDRKRCIGRVVERERNYCRRIERIREASLLTEAKCKHHRSRMIGRGGRSEYRLADNTDKACGNRGAGLS